MQYWMRWCPSALESKDYETLARFHNGGPSLHRIAQTAVYWRKVSFIDMKAQLAYQQSLYREMRILLIAAHLHAIQSPFSLGHDDAAEVGNQRCLKSPG